MKKTMFYILTLSLIILMAGSASAQIVLPEVTITGTARNVPQKVDKAFKSTFKGAEDPIWYEANKNLLVKFINNDMRNSAVFRKNGALVYNISYGFEKDVPDNVSQMIDAKYEDYDVVVAFNVKQDQRDIWVVNLENDKRYITVRMEDGIMSEASRTKKSR